MFHRRRAQVTPPVAPARIAVAVLVLGCGAFAALAADLLLQGPVTAADAAVGTWLQALAGPTLTALMRWVSDVHTTRALLVMAAVAAIMLAWRRQPSWVVALVLCVPGGMLLNWAVKHAFQRARPALDGAIQIASYSFPSGHTAGATVWWGFLLVWVMARREDAAARAAATAVAVSMVLLTALSRVYLGAHYLSDVLAAVGEGAAWLALCFIVLGRWTSAGGPAQRQRGL